MTKQQKINELQSENEALRRNIYDRKQRAEFASDELAELANGIGVRPSWFKTGDGWHQALQHKAMLATQKLLKMPLREGP